MNIQPVDFARLVLRMRAAQKAYFVDRTTDALVESKRLEKAVDAAADAIAAAEKETQRRLFH